LYGNLDLAHIRLSSRNAPVEGHILVCTMISSIMWGCPACRQGREVTRIENTMLRRSMRFKFWMRLLSRSLFENTSCSPVTFTRVLFADMLDRTDI
jgi:hypothetical protein